MFYEIKKNSNFLSLTITKPRLQSQRGFVTMKTLD